MNHTSRIECGHIYDVGHWSGIVNIGRILRIDEGLLSGKSRSEIEVMLKLMMVKHYNNATGYYKKNELTSYVFYDLSGNTTSFSLEELGLVGAKKLKGAMTNDYPLQN
jgi:hypothetical protein